VTDASDANTGLEASNEPPRMRRFLSLDAPALLYVIIVFVLGSARELPQPHVANWDKFEHAAGFALMQVVLARALAGRSTLGSGKRLVLAAVLASALGALLEVYQMALPWRSADVRDWMADTIGVVIAAAFSWWWMRRRVVAVQA
jgi:VanZ family protein